MEYKLNILQPAMGEPESPNQYYFRLLYGKDANRGKPTSGRMFEDATGNFGSVEEETAKWQEDFARQQKRVLGGEGS